MNERVSRQMNPARKPPVIQLRADDSDLWLGYRAMGIPTITIGSGLLRFCETFEEQKEDALAFLIGHELAHHHQYVRKPVYGPTEEL